MDPNAGVSRNPVTNTFTRGSSPDRDVAAVSSPPHPKSLARAARAAQALPAESTLLSRATVARCLGVSTLTVWRMTQAGLLRSLKLGADPRSAVRYKATDIAAFVASRLDATE